MGVVGGAGLTVGAGLYPLAFLLSQVLASSCRDDGLDTLGSCLLGGLASLVTSGFLLNVGAGIVLWRLRVPFGPLVAALGFFVGAALAWRLFWVFNDLQEVLGRGVVWLGMAAVPLLYLGLFLLLSRTAGRLLGVGEAAGLALLLVPFLAPVAVEGTEHRRFEEGQRQWLESLPFTIYQPTTAPAGFTMRSVEGRFSSPPQLRINFRGPELAFTVIESQPYPAFAPPRSCGLGFPSDTVRDDPCERVAATPSGEPIWYGISRSSREGVYAVQLGSTVVTLRSPFRAQPAGRPEPELVRLLQALRPVGGAEFADTVLALD
ncbi:MAG TPA: hypothetical protein VHF27_07240 [Acidimicrobiales bacterium]|nr:hypothetical protein [Acidimicrobiales bacterium]